VTRTDRRGISSRALPPLPLTRPSYVGVGTCNVAETTRGRASAGVDTSAPCSRGNAGTGLEWGTVGSDEADVGRVGAVCAAHATAAGEEGPDGFSITRED
jgi:hypothetical protein